MARKTAEVLITDEGRDKGKVFVLTEMPAAQTEKWAMRALLALTKAGVEIPENIQGAGIAGIAVLGLKALGGMDFYDAEPLLDEMLQCVTIRPDPKNIAFTRALLDDDIEEIKTRLQLRAEVCTLHVGFSLTGSQSTSTSAMPVPDLKNTKTSQGLSGRSFRPGKQR